MIANNYQKYKIYYKILAVVLCVLLIIPVFGGFNIAQASSTGISIIPDSFNYNYVDGGDLVNFLPVNDFWTLIAKGLSALANIGDVSYTNTSIDCISGVMQGPCGVPLVYETYEFTVPADGTYRVAVNSYAEAAGKFAYTLFDISGNQPETVASNGTSALSTIDSFRHAVDVELLAGHTYGFYQFYFRFGLLPGQRITFSLTNSIAPVVDDVPEEDVSSQLYLRLEYIDETGSLYYRLCGLDKLNNTITQKTNIYCNQYNDYLFIYKSEDTSFGSFKSSFINNIYAPITGNWKPMAHYFNIQSNSITNCVFYSPQIQNQTITGTVDMNETKVYSTSQYSEYTTIGNIIGNQSELKADIKLNYAYSYCSANVAIYYKCSNPVNIQDLYTIYNISYNTELNLYSTYNYASESYYEEIHYTTNEAGDTYYVTDNSGQQIDCDSITIINEGDTYNITYNYITNGGSGGGDGGDGDDGGLLNWIKERILNALGSLFDEVTDFLASILGDLLNLIWKIIKGFLGIFTDILADAPAKIDDFFGAFNPNSESNIFDFWNITDLEPNYTPGGE